MSPQYALCILLVTIVTTGALQIPKDTAIATDSVTEDVPEDATIEEDIGTARRADRTKPRMLVSQGCDASAGIIRHAHFILRLHNVSTPWRKIHTLHDADFSQLTPEEDGSDDTEISNDKTAVSLSQFWPFGDMTSLRMMMGPSATEKNPSGTEVSSIDSQDSSKESRVLTQEAEGASRAVFRMHEFYKEQNKSFIFKGTIGKDLDTILSRSLFDMGTQAAEISRKNRIDQVVCMIKDCFDNDNLGHPVLNGTVSDICWKRRFMNSSDLVGYKAFIKPGAMIDAMTSLNAKAYTTATELTKVGYAMEGVLYTEDLLDFEWNKEAVGIAVKSWISLLKAWGIGPYKDRITAYLTNNAGIIEAPASHKNSISNFDQIKNTLSSGHERFAWMLRE